MRGGRCWTLPSSSGGRWKADSDAREQGLRVVRTEQGEDNNLGKRQNVSLYIWGREEGMGLQPVGQQEEDTDGPSYDIRRALGEVGRVWLLT